MTLRINIDASRRPQLIAPSLGPYPKYVIPEGTRVRIRRLSDTDWTAYTTRKRLEFSKTTCSTKLSLCFDFEDFRIWVNRRYVLKQ